MKLVLTFFLVAFLLAAVLFTNVLFHVLHLVGFFLPMVVGNWPDPM